MRNRLDYILVGDTEKVIEAGSFYAPFTDHKVVWAKVKCEGTAYGKGYWKLNNDILAEQEYRVSLRGIFQHWVDLKCLYVDRGSWWEEMKKRIKKFSIEYSTRRAQASKKVFKDLQREIAKGEGEQK